MADLAGKIAVLEACLRGHAPLLVAFSGGVDSAYLLAAARRVLGEEVRAVIADSASLPRRSLARAREVATRIGVPLDVLSTGELADENYAANPINRCYFCKAELFRRMDELAARGGFRALAYGENADDAGQIRPGLEAAREFAVIAPLKFAGLTKPEIRQLSREIGLPTADDPAQPCLSSRIPHGVPVTADALSMIEQAEEWVRSCGFRIFRVRHPGGGRALVQIAPAEMESLAAVRDRLEGGLRAIGYRTIEVDPAGYRGAGLA